MRAKKKQTFRRTQPGGAPPGDVAPDPDDVGRMLKAVRESSGWTRKDIESRVTQLIRKADRPALRDLFWPNYPGKPRTDLTLQRTIEGLEKGEPRIPIRPDMFRALGRLYDLPLLIFDSLLSATVEEQAIVENFADFFRPRNARAGSPKDEYDGLRCVYTIPQRRLKGHEVALVKLTIQPGGSSTTHTHPGDELLFVLDGTVDLYLENTGAQTVIRTGEYAHFYAEQPHAAVNTSGKNATVFIVRFYQFEYEGSRREIQADSDKFLNEARKRKPSVSDLKNHLKTVEPVLRQIVRPPVGLFEPPHNILDPIGLASFLQQLCSAFGIGLARTMKSRGAALGSRRSIEYYQYLLDGVPVHESTVDDLRALAKIFRLPPILFYGYLFPAVAGMVVIRPGGPSFRNTSQKHKSDCWPFGSPSATTSYMVPRRNLARSNISVVFLELHKGKAQSPLNFHPGYELVLPLAGRFVVKFNNLTSDPVSPGQYAYYRSNLPHSVVSVGTAAARALVIRFLLT